MAAAALHGVLLLAPLEEGGALEAQLRSDKPLWRALHGGKYAEATNTYAAVGSSFLLAELVNTEGAALVAAVDAGDGPPNDAPPSASKAAAAAAAGGALPGPSPAAASLSSTGCLAVDAAVTQVAGARHLVGIIAAALGRFRYVCML